MIDMCMKAECFGMQPEALNLNFTLQIFLSAISQEKKIENEIKMTLKKAAKKKIRNT